MTPTQSPSREPLALPADGTHWPRGVECVLDYDDFTFNDRRTHDHIKITKIDGLGDGDVNDVREQNPDRDGETPMDSSYGGRTLTLTGQAVAGNLDRVRQLFSDFKDAFDVLGERYLHFRWLDWVERFQQSGALVDYKYDAGAGTLQVAPDGSGLAPTSIANKQIHLDPGSNRFRYADCEQYVRFTIAAAINGVVGVYFRRIDLDNYLRVSVEKTTGSTMVLKVIKRSGGSDTTLLSSTTFTAVVGSTYVVYARVDGAQIRCDVFQESGGVITSLTDTTRFAVVRQGLEYLVAQVTHTLSGGDLALFPETRGDYQSGIYWTPDSVADRVSKFEVAAVNRGDAMIACKKVAKIDESDDANQIGTLSGNHRIDFLLTLRASDLRFVSRKISVVSQGITETSLMFPLDGSGLTFPVDGSGLTFGAPLGTVVNLGRSPASAIIRIRSQIAALINPVVINSENETKVGVAGTVPTNDFYEFDTFRRTVVDSAGVSHYDAVTDDTDWLTLDKGANEIIMGAENAVLHPGDGSIDFIYRHSSR